LKSARENIAFDKLSCSQGPHWATAVQRLADGDFVLETLVLELQRLHVGSIDLELGKRQRRGALAFVLFDLLDLPVAALTALAEHEASLSMQPNG